MVRDDQLNNDASVSGDAENSTTAMVTDSERRKPSDSTVGFVPGLASEWFYESNLVLLKKEIEYQTSQTHYGQWNMDILQDRILELGSQLRKVDSYIASEVILKHEKLVEGAQHTFNIVANIEECNARVVSHRRQVQALQRQLVEKGLRLSQLISKRRRIRLGILAVQIVQRVLAWDAVSQEFLFSKELKKAAASICMLQTEIENCRNGIRLDHEIDTESLVPLSNLKIGALQNWDHLHQTFVDELKQIISNVLRGTSKSFPSNRLDNCLRGLALFTSKVSAGMEIVKHITILVPSIARDVLIQFVSSGFSHGSSGAGVEKLSRLVSPSHVHDVIRKLISEFWDLILTLCSLILWCQHHLHKMETFSSSTTTASKEISPFSLITLTCNDFHTSFKLTDLAQFAATQCPDFPTNKEFIQSLQCVISDLLLGKQSLWHRIEQYLSLVLRSLPADSQESENFLQIILIIQQFCLEVRIFVSHYEGQDSTAKTYEKIMNMDKSIWDNPDCSNLFTALRSRVESFFREMESDSIRRLRSFLSEDSFQRLPLIYLHHSELIPQPHPLFTLREFISCIKSSPLSSSSYPSLSESIPFCWSKSNPFRKLSPESFRSPPLPYLLPSSSLSDSTKKLSPTDTVQAPDDFQVSNKGPVMSASSRQVCRSLSQFISLARYAPFLSFNIFISSLLLFDFYLYSVVCFFSNPKLLSQFLDPPCPPSGCFGGPRLYEKHAAFLVQRRRLTLKHIVLALRSFAASFTAPQSDFSPLLHVSMYSTNRRTNAQSSDERYSSTSKGSNCNEEESHSILLVNEHLRMLRNEIYGFIPSASSCLESPGSLWGLAERVTAVESAMSILRVLIHMYVPPMSKTVKETVGVDSSVGRFPFLRLSATELSFVVKSMQERESAVMELRDFIYYQAAEDMFNLRPFISTVGLIDWNIAGQDLNPALSQLKMQIKDLFRKIACCGGGSIPQTIQLIIWKKIGEHTVRMCIEALALSHQKFPKIGQVPASLFSLAQDFRTLISMIESHVTKLETLIHCPSSSRALIDTSLLMNYIEAHALCDHEVLTWCKSQSEINVTFLLQLIRKTASHSSVEKSNASQLEVYFSELLRCV